MIVAPPFRAHSSNFHPALRRPINRCPRELAEHVARQAHSHARRHIYQRKGRGL